MQLEKVEILFRGVISLVGILYPAFFKVYVEMSHLLNLADSWSWIFYYYFNSKEFGDKWATGFFQSIFYSRNLKTRNFKHSASGFTGFTEGE